MVADFMICILLVPVLGLCFGSFLNVVIYRLPRRESVIKGRSHCPACGKVLVWYDLVPVLSYLVLRGRCRYCQTPVSFRYPLVELATAAVFSVLFYHFGLTLVFAKYFFLACVLIAAAFIDLEHYFIPDWLVLTGFLGGVFLSFLARDGWFWSSLLGALVTGCFLFFVAVISKGGIGGGDIKLGTVVGLFLGWPLGPLSIFLGICIGGLVGIFFLVFGFKGRKDPVPFGPFIALGSFFALLWGNELIAWYLQYFW